MRPKASTIIAAMRDAAADQSVDYLVIGHLAQDLTPQGPTLGGTVAYAGLTALALGRRVGVVTSGGSGLDLAPLKGLRLVTLPSSEVTSFENRCALEGRLQFLRGRALPLGPQAVPARWRTTPIVHIGPIADEVDPALLRIFPRSLVGLTPQGWMRRWDAQGRVSPTGWEPIAGRLSLADAVVVSLEDLGGDASAAEAMAGACRLLVVTDGPRGARVFVDGRGRQFPAPAVREVDPTGAGDVFAAAFFIRLAECGDPWEAARFANQLAARSVTRQGIAAAPTPDEVEAALSPVTR